MTTLQCRLLALKPQLKAGDKLFNRLLYLLLHPCLDLSHALPSSQVTDLKWICRQEIRRRASAPFFFFFPLFFTEFLSLHLPFLIRSFTPSYSYAPTILNSRTQSVTCCYILCSKSITFTLSCLLVSEPELDWKIWEIKGAAWFLLLDPRSFTSLISPSALVSHEKIAETKDKKDEVPLYLCGFYVKESCLSIHWVNVLLSCYGNCWHPKW